MALTKQIRFDLDEKLFKKLAAASENKAEFIRSAIEEKLERKTKEGTHFNKLMKKIDNLDPQLIHQDIQNMIASRLDSANELSKQNEILKLILRRSTFSSRFGALMLEVIKKEDLMRGAMKEAEDTVANEIQEIDI